MTKPVTSYVEIDCWAKENCAEFSPAYALNGPRSDVPLSQLDGFDHPEERIRFVKKLGDQFGVNLVAPGETYGEFTIDQLNEVIRHIQATQQMKEAPAVQTIDTAPRDGTRILVYGDVFDAITGDRCIRGWHTAYFVVSDRYASLGGLWLAYDGDFAEVDVDVQNVTHWQPLPEAPC